MSETIAAPDGAKDFATPLNSFLRSVMCDPMLWPICERQLRDCMRARKGVDSLANIVDLKASLIRDGKTGTLEAYLVPSSLLDALWLQFHYSQSSGATFRTCPYCHVPFAAGGNSGRLRNTEFCSPEHRKRYNSLARSNPKMRKMREKDK